MSLSILKTFALRLTLVILGCGSLSANAFEKVTGVQSLGRTKVMLPSAGQWQLLESKTRNNAFGGSHPGEIPAEYKVWALVSEANEILSFLLMRSDAASVLQAATRLQWTNNCKQDGKSYIVDGTRGSFERLDCLRVFGRIATEPKLPAALEDVGSALKLAGSRIPSQMLYIQHNVANDQGAFVELWILLSPKFRGADGAPAQAELLNTIQPRTARWADLLAQAARGSLASLSGEYRLPDMNFSE